MKMRKRIARGKLEEPDSLAVASLVPGEVEAIRFEIERIIEHAGGIGGVLMRRSLRGESVQVSVKELIMGNKIHSGDKSVNIVNATVSDSAIAAGGAATLQQTAMSDELVERIRGVEAALAQASATHAQEAGLIRSQLEQLVAEVRRAPDERGNLLVMLGRGLAGAAHAVKDFMPVVEDKVRALLSFLGL